MNKLQRILIVILGLQLALGVFVFWPRPVASGAGQALLGELKAEEITGLTIAGEQGVSTRLVKSGDGWTAPDAGGYPADASKIAPVLDKLIAIKTGKPIAQTPASQAQLQVADGKFVRKVELLKADGTATTVYLGSSGGSQAVHVRLGGQDEVYLASGLATWEIDANLLSWIDPVYLAVAAADITSFTLKNQQGEFNLTKDGQGAWQLAGLESGETLDANKATTLVNSVTSLRMTEPLGKTEDAAWGLAQPSATVTLQVKSGDQTKTITLTVGAKDATDNSYVVKSSESEYYARVAEFSMQELVGRDRAGFLVATPTPAPAATP